MGCWLIAKDRINLHTKVDEELLREFIEFSEISCPTSYCREKFFNPWFFDENNMLVCHAGKFAEPSIWYKHLRDQFFRFWNIYLTEEPHIIGEGDADFDIICKERNEEYKTWIERKSQIRTCLKGNWYWYKEY